MMNFLPTRHSAPFVRGGLAAALVLTLSLPGFAQMAMGPTNVGVVTLEESEVPFQFTLAGRAVAFEETDIVPRVAGMISAIDYAPGTRVEPGDVLFQIEGDTFEVDLTAAEASVASAQAAVDAAQRVVDRYQQLEGTSVATGTLEEAQVSLASARANLSSAQAARDLAQLNLDRTQITSPISGIVGLPEVSVGAVVTANQSTALATVTRIDPIFVDIEESSKRMMEVRQRTESGTLSRGDTLDVTLSLETGDIYEGKGTMVSPGLTVSTTTGTRAIRFQFDNPDNAILPGQFLRVNLTLGTTRAVLVPQRATSRSNEGTLTAFVAVDGVAEERTLTEDGVYNNAWIVLEGVAEGDSLIVDGLTNLSDGTEVNTVPVTISDDGVVTEASKGE